MCDRCTTQTTVDVVVAKLNPSVSMHISVPEGWACNTKADSLELYLLCPACVNRESLLPTIPKPSPVDAVAEILASCIQDNIRSSKVPTFDAEEPKTRPASPNTKKKSRPL